MTIQFYNWLQCKVVHNFFEDGSSTIFELVPLQETNRQMNNYAIKMNSERSTFGLWIGKTEADPLNIETDFEGLSDLYFQLLAHDPLFINYTDLNIDDNRKLLIFSNLSDLSGSNMMHSEASASEEDTVVVLSNQFDYTLPQGNGKLEITDEDGNIILENEFSNDQPTTVLIDLQNQDPGLYTLSVNDRSSKEFFITQEALSDQCIGLVRIHMASLIVDYYEGMTYTIKFEPRSVYWQYKIILPRDHTQLSLKIEGKESETYSGPVGEDFINDDKAQVFMSSIPMPMKQMYDNHPKLEYAYSSAANGSDKLKLDLPFPRPEGLKTKRNEGGEVSFYSTTIIYV